MNKCSMRWTKKTVQLITERQNQPLREVDLNQYL